MTFWQLAKSSITILHPLIVLWPQNVSGVKNYNFYFTVVSQYFCYCPCIFCLLSGSFIKISHLANVLYPPNGPVLREISFLSLIADRYYKKTFLTKKYIIYHECLTAFAL